MDYVDAGGLRIAFRRRGGGPPLLLLHGALCDSRVWRVELASFAELFTVIAWDAPGCGSSDDPPDHFRLGDYADCLAAFLTELALGRCHVLGHSWGSSLALELWRREPELVRSLVLVGGYAGWAGSLPPEEVRRRLEFALATQEMVAKGDWRPTSMPGLFSDAMPDDRAAELVGIMADIRPVGARVMAHALAEADLRDVLPGIDVPTLLVHGDADLRSPVDVGRALQAAIPGSALAVLPGLGHECYLEDAAAFETVVGEFLRVQPG